MPISSLLSKLRKNDRGHSDIYEALGAMRKRAEERGPKSLLLSDAIDGPSTAGG